LIGFLGPQGPLSLETQGLLISTVFELHEASVKTSDGKNKNMISFFIFTT